MNEILGLLEWSTLDERFSSIEEEQIRNQIVMGGKKHERCISLTAKPTIKSLPPGERDRNHMFRTICVLIESLT